MRPRRTLSVLGFLALLALTTVAFVRVIWMPLYGDRETAAFSERQADPGVQAEIEREDRSGTRSWSVEDQQALSKLREGFRTAEFTREKPPATDQKFRLRIRRSDAQVDEYEVLMDEHS